MIVLINPYISSAERYGKDIGDIGGHQMPLGIYYLASYLLKNGIPVEVIDAEAEQLTHEEVVKKILPMRPVLAGITATTVGFRNAASLARMIRATSPSTRLVIGGPHMTAMPRETMKTGAFDFGIVQEGEVPLFQLCSRLLNGREDIGRIPNIYRYEDGDLKPPSHTFRISRLDEIPPPARHLCPDLSIYKPPVGAFRDRPVANVITSRGCPYKCIFCDNNTFGRKVRFFSASYIADEIEQLVSGCGIREIAFLDDTFILNKQRLHQIFNILGRRNIQFPWTCMTRVNNLDYETLKFMKETGCWQIRIGIESGNQEVLDFIKKGITLTQVRNVTSWCRSLKIATTGFFIIGHHIDTAETIQETIEFGLSIPLTDIVVTINTPIPGTESYTLAKQSQYGLYLEHDWMDLNYWTPTFIPDGLSRDFMLQKQKEFYRRFYSRPGVLLRQLKKARSAQGLGALARNALRGLNFVKER